MALLSVAEALERVLAHAAPLPAEHAVLSEAYGRVLTDDLKALRTQPPANVSAMDGYAVRAADVTHASVRLKIIGEVAAGRPFAQTVGPDQAARIFTGGVLPAGADTVVIQEFTKRNGDWVDIQGPTARGRHIRAEGLDFKAGDVLLSAGRRLTTRDLALAAAMNHPRIPVHRRPKVAIFATGDELVPPGTQPQPGQIVSSNTFALTALARAEGADVADLGIVGDRLDDTVAAVRGARERRADILVTSGGASVGEYDLVQSGLCRRRHGIVILETGLAARSSPDAWAPRHHAGARRSRQSGLGVRMCSSVHGAADPPPRRPRRHRDPDRNRRARLRPAGKRRARGLFACDAQEWSGWPGGDALFGAGQFHDGAAGEGRLSGDPRTLFARRQGWQPLHDHAAGALAAQLFLLLRPEVG